MRDPPSQSRRNFNVWMCSSEYNKIFSPSQSVSAIYSLVENIIKTWRNGQSIGRKLFVFWIAGLLFFYQNINITSKTFKEYWNTFWLQFRLYHLHFADLFPEIRNSKKKKKRKKKKKERKKQLWFYVPHENSWVRLKIDQFLRLQILPLYLLGKGLFTLLVVLLAQICTERCLSLPE